MKPSRSPADGGELWQQRVLARLAGRALLNPKTVRVARIVVVGSLGVATITAGLAGMRFAIDGAGPVPFVLLVRP